MSNKCFKFSSSSSAKCFEFKYYVPTGCFSFTHSDDSDLESVLPPIPVIIENKPVSFHTVHAQGQHLYLGEGGYIWEYRWHKDPDGIIYADTWGEGDTGYRNGRTLKSNSNMDSLGDIFYVGGGIGYDIGKWINVVSMTIKTGEISTDGLSGGPTGTSIIYQAGKENYFPTCIGCTPDSSVCPKEGAINKTRYRFLDNAPYWKTLMGRPIYKIDGAYNFYGDQPVPANEDELKKYELIFTFGDQIYESSGGDIVAGFGMLGLRGCVFIGGKFEYFTYKRYYWRFKYASGWVVNTCTYEATGYNPAGILILSNALVVDVNFEYITEGLLVGIGKADIGDGLKLGLWSVKFDPKTIGIDESGILKFTELPWKKDSRVFDKTLAGDTLIYVEESDNGECVLKGVSVV